MSAIFIVKLNESCFSKTKRNAILTMLPSLHWQQKGGENMFTALTFLISVTANLVSMYISKWIDRNNDRRL